MRVVFMGTPDFAVPSLLRLVAHGEEIVGVFTQPDKPKGRGYAVLPSPVKTAAVSCNLPVFQPKTLRDGEALSLLRELSPEVIAVVAYGKILPAEILELPRFGCVNIHASLLPKYRGAAPMQWAILHGETQTGVTAQRMNEGIDTGDILLYKAVKIEDNMTAGELHDVLSPLGAELLSDTLAGLKAGTISPTPQTGESSYAPLLTKDLCPIDFLQPAKTVHDHIRGLSPYPGAVFHVQGKRVKALASVLSETAFDLPAGTVVPEKDAICIVCGDGRAVCITQVQPEGKKPMPAAAYLAGHPMKAGFCLL